MQYASLLVTHVGELYSYSAQNTDWTVSPMLIMLIQYNLLIMRRLTLDIYCGRKSTTQHQQQYNALYINLTVLAVLSNAESD